MSRSNPELKMPVWQTNPEGGVRRVGVELEMNGLSVDRLAEIVAGFLKLSTRFVGRYERVLIGDPAGDWKVELDFMLLKEMGREFRQSRELLDDLKDSVENILKWLAEPLVPLELVSPPLPLHRLGEIEALIKHLREHGAKGTSNQPTNAFGMQFNPEIPDTDPEVLTAYLKAFLCLYDWIFKRANIDLTRRITRYIDPFPGDYVRLVVDPDYQPDLATLIDDYLDYNPTRNRALDLLPLFLYLDEARVRWVTDDPLIKPRPTFHYRLPNSNIHVLEWGLHESWNDWVEVENLAADRYRLHSLCAAYSEYLRNPFRRWWGRWDHVIEAQWIRR